MYIHLVSIWQTFHKHLANIGQGKKPGPCFVEVLYMRKHILIISTSLRQGANSDILAEAFAKGAQEAGHIVEHISLRDKNIHFCKGCLACQKTQRCVIHDDAESIVQKMGAADCIVFATPVYFYAMCGQMKTLLDRSNPLFTQDYAFRDIYLLATAADSEEQAIHGTLTGLQGWVSCFEKANLKGVVRGVGATDPGDMKNNPSVLMLAERMGRDA